MKENELNSLFSWVKEKLDNLPYGEIGISIHVHQGKITKIEKKTTETKK